MTGKIFLKLIAGLLCVLLLALVTVDYFATQVAKNTYIENLVQQVAEKARMLELSQLDPAAMNAAQVRAVAEAAGGRITVIRSDGKVLVDSDANPAEMENHRTRPEVAQALRGGIGWEMRQSATLGVPFGYVAVPMRDGAIRIAVPLSKINSQVNQIRRKILVSTALAFLPAFLLAAVLARSISRRFGAIMTHASELAKGNFRARLPDNDMSEFGRLAHTLNETAENLQSTVEQLQHEHAELEKLERVRKDFVINVSHELRTPLASIQGYTETLMDGALEDADHNMRFLGIIRHNAERLARITEDLLTLSRIEQKRQKFEFDCHPVNALLDDAIDLIRPMAEKNQVALEREPGMESALVRCDNEAVSQILSNLLDNAIKYTPAGGKITLGARITGDFADVFVRDTGIGIPPEELPRLFERFYRVDKARSRQLGGTGLGLSIVKHLVAAQHGTTRVESRPGEGSTFYFTIPLEEMVPDKGQLNAEFTAL